MAKDKILKNRIIAIALSLGMCTSLIVPYVGPLPAEAADTGGRYAPTRFRGYGMTYREFVEKYGEPKDTCLLVGTYLMTLAPAIDEEGKAKPDSGVSGEEYQAAMISRLTYEQDVCFYKSELAGGEWRDIQSAKDLSTIMPGNVPMVSADEMDNMLITNYDDGNEIKDLDEENEEDQKDVNPFQKPSPYNLDEMGPMQNLLNDAKRGAITPVADEESTESTKTTETSSLFEPMVAEASLADQNLSSDDFLIYWIRHMFDYDEATDTLPKKKSDASKVLDLEERIPDITVYSKLWIWVQALVNIEDAKLNPLNVPQYAKEDYDQAGISAEEDGHISAFTRELLHFSDTRDDETDKMDKAVDSLWNACKSYKKDSENGKNGDISSDDRYNALYKIISVCDATRRAKAYYNLGMADDCVLDKVNEFNEDGDLFEGWILYKYLNDMDVEEESWEDTDKRIKELCKGYKLNLNLRKAISKAKTDIEKKYIEYQAVGFAKGNTAITQLIYADQQQVIGLDKRVDKMDDLLDEIVLTEAIRDKNPKNEKKEAAIIKDKLISAQNVLFGEELAAGLPESYAAAEDDKTRQAILEAQQTTAYNAESAMEFLMDSYSDREEDKEELTPVFEKQIEWVKSVKNAIQDTDYAPYAEEVRVKYYEYLLKKASELGLDIADVEGDPLEKELKEALDEYMKVGDLAKTKKLESLYDKLKKNPVKIPDGFDPVITWDPVSEMPEVEYEPADPTDKNGNGGSSNGDDGNIKTGNDGNKDKASNGSSKNSSANKGSGNTGGNNSNSKNPYKYGDDKDRSNASTSRDARDAKANGYDPNDDMLKNLEKEFGKFSDMGPDGKIEMIAALNQYAREKSNSEAAELARTLLQQVMEENNPFCFKQYNDVVGLEYVSLASIDRARQFTRLRLVKKDGDITMSRTDTGLAYVYQYGNGFVKKTGGKKEPLVANLTAQEDEYFNRGDNERFAYLDEDDAVAKLGCRAEYIIQDEYAVTVASYMENNIKNIVKKLTEFYG